MPCAVPPASEFSDFLCIDGGEACLTVCHHQSLVQSTFLAGVLSGCFNECPTEEPCAQMFKYAVFDMARWIGLTQQWTAVLASPYQSETIGGYTYSKAMKTSLLQGWQTGRWNTGVFWFDLFLYECSCGPGNVSSDAITVFEHDSVYVETGTGRRWVLGPEELVPTGLTSLNAGFSAPAGFTKESNVGEVSSGFAGD